MKRRREIHGGKGTNLYMIWIQMKCRCHNENNRAYKSYGGRGITVCEQWRYSFNEFRKWAFENGYLDGLQIDRIDNNEGYSPENCRFTTRSINCQNTRLIRKSNKSGFRGVCFHKAAKMWISRISIDNIRYVLGFFTSPKDAAIAYNDFVIQNNTKHPLNAI